MIDDGRRLYEEGRDCDSGDESAAIVCPIPTILLDLNQSTLFELQYYCESADSNSWALGLNLGGSGEPERYASVAIRKID